MFHVDIPANEELSAPLCLANKDVATIFADDQDEACEILILGSHDGGKYGPILVDGAPLSLFASSQYTVHVMDPDDFLGVQYIKFKRLGKVDQNLCLWIHLRTF